MISASIFLLLLTLLFMYVTNQCKKKGLRDGETAGALLFLVAGASWIIITVILCITRLP